MKIEYFTVTFLKKIMKYILLFLSSPRSLEKLSEFGQNYTGLDAFWKHSSTGTPAWVLVVEVPRKRITSPRVCCVNKRRSPINKKGSLSFFEEDQSKAQDHD